MQQGKKRLATLVGCNYPNTQHELHGCINDVHAMSDVLVARFGFDRSDILILTDASGSPSLPTGANIKRALAAMIARAEPGDVLFFHYSGHGTLIPAVKPHHSWHGHDEAIVPCDFNLITDIDFRQLVDRLPAGVTFTMISDSCHSGGLIDKEKEQIGPSTTIDRTVLPQHPRIIPFKSILDHLSSLSGIDSPHVGDHLSTLFGAEASAKYSKGSNLLLEPLKPDNGILLSGCQTNETSADMSPEYGWADKAYGAFSNSIQMVLKGHEGVLSNRELVTSARALLRSQGFLQHPCLYCSDENADAPFLMWQPVGQLRSSM
uniref:Metacaspase-9 n=1 Tax=Elaeis guineensis var. tenera TaxID=51953 RepID=A0A6I9R9H5_ELAGV|nr:metacaspase-9 [Elaeis guineensis]XP_029120503.1 metacaspase-9 [Elaeis guineensis]